MSAEVERVARRAPDPDVARAWVPRYAYPPDLPLNAVTGGTLRGDGATVETLAFDSIHDQRVPARLMRPDGPGRLPCLLLLHGYRSSKADVFKAGPILASQGYATLAIDAQYHGDRAQEAIDIYSPFLERDRDAMIQTVVDCRRAVDYLRTRPDIAPDRIGYLGGSMGGILGGVVCAVEPRIRACALLVPGANWGLLAALSQNESAQALRADPDRPSFERVAEVLAPADPLHFAHLISPRPLLLQCARHDREVPAQAARALWEAAREPKEIDWYDSDHDLPLDRVVPRVLSWLREHL